MRHFCHSLNIETVNGDSAWFRRFNKHWDGPVLPFGCRVFFRPSPHHALNQVKFEPAAKPGVFVGYHLLNGHYWKKNGGLLVVDLEEFGNDLDPFCVDRAPTIQRVSEAWIPQDTAIHYPLKAIYDAKYYTITPPTTSSDVFDVTDKKDEIGGNGNGDGDNKKPNDSVEGGNHAVSHNNETQTRETHNDKTPTTDTQRDHKDNDNKDVGPQNDTVNRLDVPDDGGRKARKWRGTPRPPHIWPEMWQTAKAKEKRDATLE